MNQLPSPDGGWGDAGSGDASRPCGSAIPDPPGYDRSQIVFQDSFCGTALDTSKWLTYVPGYDDRGHLSVPLSGPNSGGLYAEYWNPSQVTVNDGLLLTAAADSTEPGYMAKSGVLTSAATVRFVGGPTGRTFVLVRVKVPSTDGMWPMVNLGSPGGVNAPLVTLLSTGFTNPEGPPLETVQAGVQAGAASSYVYYDTRTNLSTDYVDYGVEIVWGQSMTWFWNAIGAQPQKLHQVQSASGDGGIAIPTSGEGQTLFIELDVVNSQAAGWHTVWNGTDSDTFGVAAIQVYAR
jgi:hypothetical protein